jgi:hypothetical protein
LLVIQRAVSPKVRLDMQLAAADAGLEIDPDQLYDEHGFRRPRKGAAPLRGKAQIVPDGAKTAGAIEAARGVDNPKDPPAGAAPPNDSKESP